MTDAGQWEESDSDFFIKYGDIITPSRAEQLAMVTGLIPAESDEEFFAVDLACGAGSLSGALLHTFPHCRVLALDVSPLMLDTARRNLAQFHDRLTLGQFDLRARDWLDRIPTNTRCVVSSLSIHHLDGPEKQDLFAALAGVLPDGAALLIVDLVEPVEGRAAAAYASAWDAITREQSIAMTGSMDAYGRFRDGWNHFATPDVEFDKPSNLFLQLQWLAQAGFRTVDCFWIRAGHAIYGGYK